MAKLCFTILCILMVIAEMIIMGVLLKRKPEKMPTKLFACILISSSVTILSYCVSIYSLNYFVMSLFSSIYFCSIDVLLLIFLDLVIKITDFKMHKFQVVTRWMARIYAIFDIVVLLINPFCEIALNYEEDPQSAGHWVYSPGILYQLHLVLCYIVIIMVVYCLVLKIIQTPPLYRIRYTLILGGLMLIVILNALFLFVSSSIAFKYDVSVVLYGVMCMLVYYNCVYYSKRKLMQTAPIQVLDDLSHPVILFDYEKNFVIANNAAKKLTHENESVNTMDEFIKWLKIEDKIVPETENTSFQFIVESKMYRCDFQTLRKKNSLQGYVFSFVEISTEFDMLTGFHSESAYVRDFADNDLKLPAGVLVCDINQLARINELYGHDAGDRSIASVANIMRIYCPEKTYFVRLHDAIMAGICPETTLAEIKKISAQIENKTKEIEIGGEPLLLTSAFAMCTNDQEDVRKIIESAEDAVRTKKMLDPNSAHSSLLFSLARVLQESDPGTEEHVMRTRIMGEKLSERLGLSDEEASRLSLLCLLHDVGKLGIPLEILNKPGKLTTDEWELLKTHAKKGWQIAKASSELSPIANLILCHHERWDGKGYPNGLSKEEIPILSRIISIIDSYDAMTNDRPYKKKMSRHKAVLEVERCAGTQFDPYIAKVFCKMICEQPEYINEDLKEENDVPSVSVNDYGTDEKEDALKEKEENSNIAPIRFSRYILDSEGGQILSVDKHFEYMTGYSEEDVNSGLLTQNLLIFPEDRESYNLLKDKMLSSEKEAFIEHRLRMKDGACRFVCCHGWPYYDTAHKELRSQVIITDITESASLKRMVNAAKKTNK